MDPKLRLSLTFLLNEDVTPDLFAQRVAQTTGAMREGEGIELPSDPTKVLQVVPAEEKRMADILVKYGPPAFDTAVKQYTDAVIARMRARQIGGYGGGYKNTKLYKSLVTPYEHAERDAYNALLEECRKRA